MPKQTWNFKDVIVASVVADRVNKGYIKETNYIFNEDTDKYVPTSMGNKNIMREMLLPGSSNKDDMNVLKLTPITATEGDFDLAQQICDHIEGFSFKALSDELQGYEKTIYEIFEDDKVTTYDFGILASFPSSFKRSAKKEAIELKIAKTCGDSEYIGKQGDKVQVDVKIVNHIFSRNYMSHIYTGITNDNCLVNFWSQKNTDELGKVGSKITITGKVKRTSESRFYPGVKETQLNFVKKIAS